MTDPRLIDTHCHLHFPAYEQDTEEMLTRLQNERMWAVTIGTALHNSREGVAFAEAHDGIWAAVGLHPEHVTSIFYDEQEGHVSEHDLDGEALCALAQSSKKVVAIGETGLDFYRLGTDIDPQQSQARQEQAFRQHIEVALSLDLPLVIHCRDALARLAKIVQEYATQGTPLRGAVHSFTGTWLEAQPLLDLGLFLGINGIATFPQRKTQTFEQMIDRTIERAPLSQVVLETDSPYLAPLPYRGKRNEPAYLVEVARHVARVRGADFEKVMRQTTENARRLYGI